MLSLLMNKNFVIAAGVALAIVAAFIWFKAEIRAAKEQGRQEIISQLEAAEKESLKRRMENDNAVRNLDTDALIDELTGGM